MTRSPILRLLISCLLVLALVAEPLPAMAAKRGFSAIAVDARTGKVLVARDADAQRYPASITKVMTLYVLFEEMKAGRLKKTSRLKVSAKAARQPPSRLGLKSGQTITVDDAIKALVTRSANDVAMVVAENVSGSQEAFAKRMTATARELGMTRTRYRNPSGLPDKAQVTTARDIATLSLRIQRDFPQYYSYFRIRSFVYKGTRIGNHNRLLGTFRGTDGIKTGYINASGFNLTTSVVRGNKRLIGVVIGAPSAGARNRYMTAMLEPLFAKAQNGRNIASYAGKAPAGLKQEPAKPEVQLAEMDSDALAAKTAKVAAAPTAKVPLPRAKPEVIEARVEEPAAEPEAEAEPEVAQAPEPPVALPSEATSGEEEDKAEDATTFTAVVVEEELPSREEDIVAMTDIDIDTTREDTKAIFQQGELTWPVSTAERKSDYRSFAPVQTASAAGMPAIPVLQEEPAVESPSPVEQPIAQPEPEAQPETAALAEPEAQPEAKVAATATPEAAPSDEWQVQIGAWKQESDAQRRLDRAAKLNLGALEGKQPLTLKTDQKGKTVFTARFGGFASRDEARQVCRTLSRKGFGCLPIAPGQSG